MWLRILAVGALFGAVTTLLNVPPEDHVLDDGPRRVVSLVLNSGTAWAGIAVAGGLIAGPMPRGLAAGPLALITAVVTYYLVGAVAGSENADGSPDQIAFFGVAALVTGPLLGAVGSVIRRPGRHGLAAALVLPAGVLAERLWRGASVAPDPARPAADAVLLAVAAAGAAAAVARYLARRG